MKRLRHIVWTGLAVVSALLLVATLALWARSYKNEDICRYINGTLYSHVSSLKGAVAAYYRQVDAETPRPKELSWSTYPWDGGAYSTYDEIPNKWLGFGWICSNGGGYDVDAIVVPHWFLSIVFLAYPVFRFVPLKRNRGLQLCSHCGYDLRATPDRCPECGAVPADHHPSVQA